MLDYWSVNPFEWVADHPIGMMNITMFDALNFPMFLAFRFSRWPHYWSVEECQHLHRHVIRIRSCWVIGITWNSAPLDDGSRSYVPNMRVLTHQCRCLLLATKGVLSMNGFLSYRKPSQRLHAVNAIVVLVSARCFTSAKGPAGVPNLRTTTLKHLLSPKIKNHDTNYGHYCSINYWQSISLKQT